MTWTRNVWCVECECNYADCDCEWNDEWEYDDSGDWREDLQRWRGLAV